MFLTQPPARLIDGEIIHKGIFEPDFGLKKGIHLKSKVFKLIRPEGVRIGHLGDLFVDAEAKVGQVDWTRSWLSSTGMLMPTEEDIKLYTTDSATAKGGDGMEQDH